MIVFLAWGWNDPSLKVRVEKMRETVTRCYSFKGVECLAHKMSPVPRVLYGKDGFLKNHWVCLFLSHKKRPEGRFFLRVFLWRRADYEVFLTQSIKTGVRLSAF